MLVTMEVKKIKLSAIFRLHAQNTNATCCRPLLTVRLAEVKSIPARAPVWFRFSRRSFAVHCPVKLTTMFLSLWVTIHFEVIAIRTALTNKAASYRVFSTRNTEKCRKRSVLYNACFSAAKDTRNNPQAELRFLKVFTQTGQEQSLNFCIIAIYCRKNYSCL